MPPTKPTAQRVELEPWEIGAELLDILSRGLYSDARDTIREYVQNGVDAGARLITITVDGPTVVVRDDGLGMDETTLRAARRFGLSSKTPKTMVGYRGIGIYAAFGMAETMTIRTRQQSQAEIIGWQFSFGEMRRILETDKSGPARHSISLTSLLHQYSLLIREPYQGEPTDAGFTTVRLEGIGSEFRSQLNAASAITEYLLMTLPVAYPFETYGSKVNAWLQKEVGLVPISINLRIGNEPSFTIAPPMAEDVMEPEFSWIETASGKRLAFVWHALSSKGARIPDDAVSGFLLKQRGFTLGDRGTLKSLWPPVGARTLFHHHTGEVHILPDAEVYPNAARNDLEPSPNKQVFYKHLSDHFEILSRKANVQRVLNQAKRELEGVQDAVEKLAVRLGSPDEDPFAIYAEARQQQQTFETILRQITRETRPGRRRGSVPLSDDQLTEVKRIVSEIEAILQRLEEIQRSANQSTARNRRRDQSDSPPVPPQVALLAAASAAARAASDEINDSRLTHALASLESATQLRLVPRAVAVLDELKADGVPLGGRLESIRKQLRSFLGWSPVAPVSLHEAVAQAGVALATEREDAFVRAVDAGLLSSLGGRGERYETALRTVADAIAEALGEGASR